MDRRGRESAARELEVTAKSRVPNKDRVVGVGDQPFVGEKWNKRTQEYEKKDVSEDAVVRMPEKRLFGVADGVSTGGGGALASEMMLEVMVEGGGEGRDEFDGLGDALDEKIENWKEAGMNEEQIIRAIKREFEHGVRVADQMIEFANMAGGTTFTGAKIVELGGKRIVCWGNVGDSRIRVYNKNTKEMHQITTDDSLLNEGDPKQWKRMTEYFIERGTVKKPGPPMPEGKQLEELNRILEDGYLEDLGEYKAYAQVITNSVGGGHAEMRFGTHELKDNELLIIETDGGDAIMANDVRDKLAEADRDERGIERVLTQAVGRANEVRRVGRKLGDDYAVTVIDGAADARRARKGVYDQQEKTQIIRWEDVSRTAEAEPMTETAEATEIIDERKLAEAPTKEGRRVPEAGPMDHVYRMEQDMRAEQDLANAEQDPVRKLYLEMNIAGRKFNIAERMEQEYKERPVPDLPLKEGDYVSYEFNEGTFRIPVSSIKREPNGRETVHLLGMTPVGQREVYLSSHQAAARVNFDTAQEYELEEEKREAAQEYHRLRQEYEHEREERARAQVEQA